jgi:hypothetical protein
VKIDWVVLNRARTVYRGHDETQARRLFAAQPTPDTNDEDWLPVYLLHGGEVDRKPPAPPQTGRQFAADAVQALRGLGFKAADAQRKVEAALAAGAHTDLNSLVIAACTS